MERDTTIVTVGEAISVNEQCVGTTSYAVWCIPQHKKCIPLQHKRQGVG